MIEDVFGIVGAVIADTYEVEAPVAEGGFAVVYRAHHRAFRAKVALKCLKLNPSLAEYGRRLFLEQFRAEAEILYQLSARLHEVVRPLHVDALTTKKGEFVPFLVLEWLEGDTLDIWVRRRSAAGTRPLGIRRLVRLLTPVARALDTAHHFTGPTGTSRVVHCDLKPQNIVMTRAGNDEFPKILDFGIARVRTLAAPLAVFEKLPHTFTPRYAAPEQWQPKRYGTFGPWTDVWGLALTLVEVLLPNLSSSGDPMSVALDPRARPTPRALGVDIPEAAERVFAQALAVDPAARYRDVASFWDELLQSLELEPGLGTGALARDQRRDAGRVVQVESISISPPRRVPSITSSRVPPNAKPRSELPRAPFPFLGSRSSRADGADGITQAQNLDRDTRAELGSVLRPRAGDASLEAVRIPRAASLPQDLLAEWEAPESQRARRHSLSTQVETTADYRAVSKVERHRTQARTHPGEQFESGTTDREQPAGVTQLETGRAVREWTARDGSAQNSEPPMSLTFPTLTPSLPLSTESPPLTRESVISRPQFGAASSLESPFQQSLHVRPKEWTQNSAQPAGKASSHAWIIRALLVVLGVALALAGGYVGARLGAR